MKKLLLLLLAIIQIVLAKSQDVHFSQFSETPLLINPASAGMIRGFCRATVNYKNQWQGMGDPYRSMMASYDMPLLVNPKKKGHLGIGATFLSDNAGAARLSTNAAQLSISGIVALNENSKLGTGIQAGLVQRSADISKLQFVNQYNGQTYDPTMPTNEVAELNSFSYFDLSAGVNYSFLKTSDKKDVIKFNVGVAYFHLTNPQQKFYQTGSEGLYRKMVINTTGQYDFPETKLGIIGSALFMSQGPATEITTGALLRRKLAQGTKYTGFISESAIAVGALYRVNDAVIPQVIFELASFSVGVSYDVNISSLSQATRKAGGFEISIKYFKGLGALFQGKK